MSKLPQFPTRKSPPTTAPAVRKRRKRTVVTGAAHDCFTCAGRGSSCDRRRPYCSQCLEYGLDCSGYKTTLIWGVGVASRGKFRGLSLPVTGAQPATGKVKSPGASGHPEPQLPSTPPIPICQPFAQPSPASDTTHENFPSTNIPSPQVHSSQWHHSTSIDNLSDLPPQFTLTDWSADAESSSAPGNWTGESWSPTFQPQPTAEWPYQYHTEDTEPDETLAEWHKRRSSHTYSFVNNAYSPSLSQMLLARAVGQTPRLRYLISYYAEVIAPVIVAFDSPTNPFRTSILRMAQDSISLQEAIATLSTSNLRQRRERGIFSTGRTEPARMSSLALRALTDYSLQECCDPSIPEGFALEQQYHRGMAVKELNKELADPHRRLSDSVLATLFILCLFHVCDTGVAQFKTQFAGVTKLLAIRMRTSSYLSEELKWFIRMFTWYDTMTATTNDRELQLQSRCVDLTAASDGEWGLENLAGCDAGLFKIISHLGRLNILSQNQESETHPLPHSFIPTSAPPPSMTYNASNLGLPGPPPQFDSYMFPLPTPPRPSDQTEQPTSLTFWAEWYSIRQQLEAWRFPPERSNQGHSVESYFAVSPRSHMGHVYISPPSSPLSQCGVAPQNVEDVFHISESFRHSAMLYSERLAYPDLPSSHPRIQQIVQRSMAHIEAVRSDVYLLWPLFITGSECVLQEHRLVIQERCKDISKDSGFCNNLSCLALLHKIWEENPPVAVGIDENGSTYTGASSIYPLDWSPLDKTVSLNSVSKGHGFRWHRVMQSKRAQGEYMVV